MKFKIKNPNSLSQKTKRYLIERWSDRDPATQISRLSRFKIGKDLLLISTIPLLAFMMAWMILKLNEPKNLKPSRMSQKNTRSNSQESKSQIIEFASKRSENAAASLQRSPGTLIKVKLLNSIQTSGSTPVHAQIIDHALGSYLMGGTLLGDATPDYALNRIQIQFKYAKHPKLQSAAYGVSARALSLDGTSGIEASFKEGFTPRGVLTSGSETVQMLQGQLDSSLDLGRILIRALTNGLLGELGSGAKTENTKAHLLTLEPFTEFYAELTDFFPRK